MRERIGADQRGFTLIEVMVAALILVIALGALATVFVGSEGQASAATRQSQLMNLADQQIEQVRAEVEADGFNALALQSVPSPATGFAAPGSQLSTYADPNALALTDSSCGLLGEEYEIESNFDSLPGLPSTTVGQVLAGSNSAAATKLNNPPQGFSNWATCDGGAEPLEVISGDTMIQAGGSNTTCSTSQLYGECEEAVGSSLSGSGTSTMTIDTYVTDTYVGCGTSGGALCPVYCTAAGYSATAGTCSSAATTNCAAATPTTSCAVYGCTGGSTSSTFPTSTASSTSCADARRVIVAVVPGTPSSSDASDLGRVTAVYTTTIFTNPTPSSLNQSSVGIQLGASL